MIELLKRLTKNLPTLLTAFTLAISVWIMAVTATDPVEKRSYPYDIPLEVIGLDSNLIITSNLPDQISLSLSAPASLWNTLMSDPSLIRAIIDLTGLQAGSYNVDTNIQISAKPVKLESIIPSSLDLVIEPLYSKTFPIKLIKPSNPAVGYEAGTAVLDPNQVTVSGPVSIMEQVVEVRAILNISQASEDIDRNLQLNAYDKNGIFVEGIIITPDTVNAKMKIDQRGGYRNLSVKVVTSGQVAEFYSLTNISVNPPVVTVYSTDAQLIDELPGYIETQPLDLNRADEDIEVSLPLNLPSVVIAVGESTVKVHVTVSPFEGSDTFTISTIEIIGLSPELSVELSPEAVDVILYGPLPILDSLKADDIRVILDLTDYDVGIHQMEPRVELDTSELSVESILPSVIEVTISTPPTAN